MVAVRRRAAAALAALATTAGVYGQCNYTAVAIAPAPCGGIRAVAINNHGEIAGWRLDCGLHFPDQSAFRWTPRQGFVTVPDTEEPFWSKSKDLNDDPVVAGDFALLSDGFASRGFSFDGETFTIVSPPAGRSVMARAINGFGHVAGDTTDRSPFRKAFVLRDGVMTLIEPTFGSASEAYDLNDRGQVVGTMWQQSVEDAHAFLWAEGDMVDLGTVPEGDYTVAVAINDLGQIVIQANVHDDDGAPYRSFLRDAQGLIDLGVPAGQRHVLAARINDFGQIVGFAASDDHLTQTVGFLWQHDVITPFDELVLDGDVTISRAEDINQAGQVAATGTLAGARAAFVLTPTRPCVYDVDCDGQVGEVELRGLLAGWGEVSGDHAADFNDDGRVDVIDLLDLLAHWGPAGAG